MTSNGFQDPHTSIHNDGVVSYPISISTTLYKIRPGHTNHKTLFQVFNTIDHSCQFDYLLWLTCTGTI